MGKIVWLSLMLIGLGVGLGKLLRSPPHSSPSVPASPVVSPPSPPQRDIQYKSHTVGNSVVHTLLIPTGRRFAVIPAVSQELSSLEQFAEQHQALAVINGGFFDPENHKSTSYVVRQGERVADPMLNERLMQNPNLAPYLEKILNRTEFRRYQCGEAIRYALALHTESPPSGCQLLDALGGGPQLLPLTLRQEGFVDIANGQVIRDPLGSRQPNARSAVGMTHDGSILWVMVAQKPDDPTSSGMSLEALSAFMKTQAVEKALNLDGGSSASLYYKGKTFYGKVDETGNSVKRQVKSVLVIQEN